MNRLLALVTTSLALLALVSPCYANAEFNLETARLSIDDQGFAEITFAQGAWPKSATPAFSLTVNGSAVFPKSVRQDANDLVVVFANGTTARFSVLVQNGFVVFRLKEISETPGLEQFQLFQLGLPEGATVRRTLNAAVSAENLAAVVAGEPNVLASYAALPAPRADRSGIRHEFAPTKEAKVGQQASRFTSVSDGNPGGWSMRGKMFPKPLDLTGLKAIRAWVHGDGKGQMLKFQLNDGKGGARDVYMPINFEGWRHVTLTENPYDKLNYSQVTGIQLYYNSLPVNAEVTCLIDQIEAVVERDGQEQVVLLEDFESPESPFWDNARSSLRALTATAHGITPAAFAVLACPTERMLEYMPLLEQAAQIPSPRLGGTWNKVSPSVKQSYLFLTRFNETQFDQAVALARQGGFKMILLGQESWARTTGHYEINRTNFPEGLEGLRETIARFHEAGFGVGLHFLGPSIYAPDAYLTPVPDPRLVKDANTTLAAAIDEKATFIPASALSASFPEEDGGYTGNGTTIQIGNELIRYTRLSRIESNGFEGPIGFEGCQRGFMGTQAASHAAGARVDHLMRSYGYHMFDMDTPLIDEVATHFAKVANTCKIDMVYFDGSERLQGDHWYYNAKLHKTFYDKLENKNTLLQASSHSHYSWHLVARSASADGHGDLKGYLEERSPAFTHFSDNAMPLDIGWYYGYDPESTIDQYEYILAATIGYDSSMSYQVSVDAAKNHPFSDLILDLIATYEQLRLSGRVPDEMRKRLRIAEELVGKNEEQRAQLIAHRRDYRLMHGQAEDAFQRVIYGPWQELGGKDASQSKWTLEVPSTARVGFQIHLRSGAWLNAGPSYSAPDAIPMQSFDDLAPFTANPGDRDVAVIDTEPSASVSSNDVTQTLRREAGGKEGSHFAVYQATSKLPTAAGWSVMRSQFTPELDISKHAAIGLWMRGNGKGGKFKLQLLDNKGKAMDYYLDNNYEGWQYHQLPRPATDSIDYGAVRSLLIYFNGLPGQTTIACGLDGVKALPRLDEATLSNPWIQIGDSRLQLRETMRANQYLFGWPGEPIRSYGPTAADASTRDGVLQTIELPAGSHAVSFGHDGGSVASLRVRTTLQTEERHVIPKK